MAAALQARGVAPGAHVALLGPPPGRCAPPSRPCGCAAPPSSCCRCRCGSGRSRSSPATRARVPAPTSPCSSSTPTWPPSSSPSRATPRRAATDLLGGADGAGLRPARDRPRRLAILQFTCGSTADPKGVMLPHRDLRQPRRHLRRPSSTPTSTCSCRGCRCTTTWGWSASCSP